MTIGVIKQKGGVAASTLCRTIAVSYALGEWSVKIADMDTKQGTSTKWNARRMSNEIKPTISVEQFATVTSAKKQLNNYDLLIFDGAPHSSSQTLEIAKASNLILIPCGVSIDDLEPTVLLCHELEAKKINMENVYIVFSRVGNSHIELSEGFKYMKMAGYKYLSNVIYEKTAIRRASDEGKAAQETRFKSVNDNTNLVLQDIINIINDLIK